MGKITLDTEERRKALTAKHHAIVENGDVRIVIETDRKKESFLKAALNSSKTGEPIAPAHKDIQDLIRARFADKGVTIDSFIDTLEDARKTARNRDGLADHKTRMEAVKIEATMMGIMQDGKVQQSQLGQIEPAKFDAEAMRGKSKDEIVASVIRKLRAAQSNGQLSEEEIDVNPAHVATLSKYSMAAIGEEVAGDISVKIRPNSKINPLDLGDIDVITPNSRIDIKADAKIGVVEDGE